MTIRTTIRPHGLRSTWAAVHDPAPDVPRWARNAALLIPIVVLPSSVWRIVAVAVGAFGADSIDGDAVAWLSAMGYVLLLSVVSEGLALCAIGLVATWGEVFPRWVPRLHGRRVPTAAAVIPAAAGATILTVLWTWTIGAGALGLDVRGRPLSADNPISMERWEGVVAFAAYAPLVLWGPLLAAVTLAYRRRRRAAVTGR